MGVVVVERFFEEPTSFEEVQARELRIAWCLERHRVRFLRSFFSRDARHMACIYEAPDAESVRATQKQGDLPFEQIWSAELFQPPAPPAPTSPSEIVIVQRALPRRFEAAEIAEMMGLAQGCMSLHRATLELSYIAIDGLRMLCRFTAPDAESVRIANQQAGLPVLRAWSSTLHEA